MSIRIGTSGWSYPSGKGTWNGVFYPRRRPRGFDELAYYADHFGTVEVNSTFYRMPEAEHARGWVRRTPASFEFAVKLYQKLTHPTMYLAKTGQATWDVTIDDLDQFRAGVDPFAEAGRLAAILIQFPPSFHAEPATLAYVGWLLHILRAYPRAVELRHASWRRDADATCRLLQTHGASWAMSDDPSGPPNPVSWPPDAGPAQHHDLTYIRLHGRNAASWWTHKASEDRYDYLYSPQELAPFTETVRAASKAGRKVLLYFNNHFSAKAVANATVLTHQLGEPVRGDYPREMIDRYPVLRGIVSTSELPL